MSAPAKSGRVHPGTILLAVLVGASIAITFRRQGGDLLVQLTRLRMNPALLAGALALAVVYRVLNSCGWVLALRALRCPLPVLPGVRVWLIAETMRWLPGSIWSYVSRVYAARPLGISAGTATLSISLELVLTLGAWALTAALGLWFSGLTAVFAKHFALPAGPLVWSVLAGLALGGLAGAWLWRQPAVLARLPRKVAALLADVRALARTAPRADYCLATLCFYLLLCVLNGFNFWLLLRALSPASLSVGAIIGINAIGWLVGFFAFMAPGGLGVREAGIAGLLAVSYPLPVAIGGALLWRFVQITAELLCLLGCLAAKRLAQRHLEAAPLPAR